MSTYGQYSVPTSDIMVNLGVGQPNNNFLPLNMIKKGMKDFIENENDNSVLQYGYKSGYETFRVDLANFIEKQINKIVNPNDLYITNGVTGALTLICSIFGKNKDTVIIIEDPTYFLALNIFKDYGFKIETISINDTYTEQIENIIKNNKDKNIMLYTIPTFQNPTNYTMPDSIRVSLVNLTNQYNNFMIIADEVYQFLYFNEDNNPPAPLYYYGGNVISIGSFSKILCPALRIGWIQANKQILDRIDNSGIMESGGGLNILGSRIIQSLIKYNDANDYLEMCRKFLSLRGEYMYQMLHTYLNEYCEFEKPKGGYFIWIKMKDPRINTKEMLDLAIKNKVRYHFGEKFSISNDANRYLRLSFSWYNLEDIQKGIYRLKQTIEEYIKNIN